jgi:hypothetical protein
MEEAGISLAEATEPRDASLPEARTMDTAARLQRWFQARCDGDWEQEQGLRIVSYDNPGWGVTIDLAGTPLAKRTFVEVRTDGTGDDWYRCWVEDATFRAVGAPPHLQTMLEIFLDWAESAPRARRKS